MQPGRADAGVGQMAVSSAAVKRPVRVEIVEGRVARMIVTIDGPAGTGKSSVGRALAARLGLEFLDTGAMYRAATALAIDNGLSLDDGEGVAELARKADLHFDWEADPPTLMAFGKLYAHRLRDPDVTSAVSPVSALAPLREVLVRKQRLIGSQHPRLVTEGRDQGTVVFPGADVKLFLDASARVRAERRARQLAAAGIRADVDDIERELARRDHADASRAVGPLRRPEDAVVVDTSNLDFNQVVGELFRIVRERTAHAHARRDGEPERA